MGYLRFDAEVGRYFGDLKLAASWLGGHLAFRSQGLRAVPISSVAAETEAHLQSRCAERGCRGLSGQTGRLEAFGVKLYSEIGKRFPLYCTGMGKVLLAGHAAQARGESLLARRLAAFTPHTITEPGTAWSGSCGRSVGAGIALDQQEITRGSCAFARRRSETEKGERSGPLALPSPPISAASAVCATISVS